jgi:hypothetical protein
MKTLLFYKKEAEHQAPCYGKEMASSLLPTRAWEAKRILLSDKVYKRPGNPPLSVSKLSTDRLTSVLVEGARTQEEQEADHDDLLQIVQ